MIIDESGQNLGVCKPGPKAIAEPRAPGLQVARPQLTAHPYWVEGEVETPP